jgi:hypothetical protein
MSDNSMRIGPAVPGETVQPVTLDLSDVPLTTANTGMWLWQIATVHDIRLIRNTCDEILKAYPQGGIDE